MEARQKIASSDLRTLFQIKVQNSARIWMESGIPVRRCN